MRVVSLGESQESSTLVELRGTRVLVDAGLGLAASARLVRGEVGCSGDDGSDVDADGASKEKRKPRRRRRATGRGEFLISPPAYRTALFEATDCGAIDAVLATSAAGLLGLPYLVQAAAEAVGGRRAVEAGDPRAGGVVGARREESDGDGGDSLPAFLDPPFEVFATDLAVEMALAWISELGAASAAAAEEGDVEEEEDDDGGREAKRPKGAEVVRRRSPAPSSRPLAGLPASELESLTEGARVDLFGAGAGPSRGGDAPSSPSPPLAWRRAYPASLARSLLSSAGGRSSSGGVEGRVVKRVSYGERVRLRGGALVAVASPAGGAGVGDSASASAAPPGSAVWTLVDAVAEASASLAECSGRGAGEGEESGVARVVCVGACGGLGTESSSSSCSAAAPLDVSALKGAYVLVLAPPEEPPPPRVPRPLSSTTTTSPSPSCFALAAAAAASALDRGGSALFPIPSAGDGRALELVEAVLSALAPRLGGGPRGGGSAPLVVLASPGAKRATAASCASAEWLCAARSALALSGRAPYFAGAAAAAAASVIGGGGGSESNAPPSSSSRSSAGGLAVANSLAEARRLHGWRETCVAFVPESSLFSSGSGGGGGGGDGAALLRSWGRDPRCSVVFSYSLSALSSGTRLSELVSRAFPRMRARVVDVEEEIEASKERKASPSSRALSLASLAAAASPGVLVVPRRWERAILEASADASAPLGKACARIEPLEPLVALELSEGGGRDALPAPLSRAGVTSELASAAAKGAPGSSSSSRVLALATLRDGEVELDAPPGAGAAGGGAAAVAAALVVARRPPSSSLDALLSELGAPPPIKAEEQRA